MLIKPFVETKYSETKIMKTSPQFSVRSRAFTLIELLVVISIIAILASLLLPVIGRVKLKAQIKQAQTDMYNIKAAVEHYETEYNRLPGITNADTTFGYTGALTSGGTYLVAPITPIVIASNTDLTVILLNENRFVNLNHARNPQQNVFYEGKHNADIVRAGISTIDWQIRDPWGNPYIITLDLNYDGKCYDAVYRRFAVSQVNVGNPTGFNGLNNEAKTDGNSDDYTFGGDMMIWSMGPDGQASDKVIANDGVNKDNIIGW
jgi:prepilin-type N-terminal cleavage/methylation domain-containing protein